MRQGFCFDHTTESADHNHLLGKLWRACVLSGVVERPAAAHIPQGDNLKAGLIFHTSVCAQANTGLETHLNG